MNAHEVLYLFIELEMATHFSTLLDEFALLSASTERKTESQQWTSPVNPDIRQTPLTAEESAHNIQQMALADLDLGFDYGIKTDERFQSKTNKVSAGCN